MGGVTGLLNRLKINRKVTFQINIFINSNK